MSVLALNTLSSRELTAKAGRFCSTAVQDCTAQHLLHGCRELDCPIIIILPLQGKASLCDSHAFEAAKGALRQSSSSRYVEHGGLCILVLIFPLRTLCSLRICGLSGSHCPMLPPCKPYCRNTMVPSCWLLGAVGSQLSDIYSSAARPCSCAITILLRALQRSQWSAYQTSASGEARRWLKEWAVALSGTGCTLDLLVPMP